MIEHKSITNKRENTTPKAIFIRDALAAGEEIIVTDIEVVDTKEKAHEREQWWINYFGTASKGHLVNGQPGGDGTGKVISAEARAKMSLRKAGNTINKGRPRPDFREKTRKDVTVFDGAGNVIGSFETGRLASEATGVSFKSVSEAARGRVKATKSSEGKIYQFRFGIISHNIAPSNYRTRRLK